MMTISGSMTVKIKTIDNGTKLQSQKVSPLMEGGNIFSLEGLRAFDEDTEKLVDFFLSASDLGVTEFKLCSSRSDADTPRVAHVFAQKL